jgi:hypothetical protein
MIAWGLALLAVLAQLPLHDRTLVPMDEGHLAAAASWLLDGKPLYREIHTGIFPGIYLLTAGLFDVFGENLIVTRRAAVVMNTVIVVTLFGVTRRMVRLHWAIAAALLHLVLVVVSFPVLSMFNYSTLAVCYGLVALLFLLRYLEGGRSLDGVLVGLALAGAALTKQNFGGLIFLALLAGGLVCRRDSALADRTLVRSLLPIVLAGAGLTAAVISYFVVDGTMMALLDSTLLSLGGSQLQDFNNPIPPIFGAHPPDDGRFTFLYLPPTFFDALVHNETVMGVTVGPFVRSLAIRISYGVPLLALVAAPLVLWRSPVAAEAPVRRARLCAVIFAVVFSPGIFPSAIWSHLAFVLIPILLLYAYLADRLEDRLSGAPRARLGMRALGALLGVTSVAFMASVSADIMRRNAIPLELERGSLRVSERLHGLFGGAQRFVDECTRSADEPIFVAPDMPAVYFLTDHENPTPYDLTIPGNVDGDLIVRRLEERGVRCIVYNPQMYPEFPPFTRLFPRLARYLQTRFRGEEVLRGGESEWIGLVRAER